MSLSPQYYLMIIIELSLSVILGVERVGDVTADMGQAGLLPIGVILLSVVAVQSHTADARP